MALASWFRSRSSEETEGEDEEDLPWPPIASSVEEASSQVVEPIDGSAVEPREWITCDGSGNCPSSHPIKAKDSSGLYHVPVERCTREQFRIDVTLLQRLQNLMGIDHHSVNEFVLKFVGLLLNTE